MKKIVNPTPVVNSGHAVVSNKRFDGWQNVFSGLGMAGMDKRVSSTWNYDRLVEIDVENAYASDDMAAKIIDKLPDTAMQKGLNFVGMTNEQESNFYRKLKQLQFRSKFTQFKKWGRMYGGSALLVGTDEDDDLTMPLRPSLVNNVTSLTLISRYELYPSQVQYNPLEPNFGFPEFYRLQLRGTSQVNGHEVHHSRILRSDGVLLPRRLHIQNQYWGDSVLSRLANVIRNHGTSHDSIATVLQDFRIAVFKIKNLADMLANGDDGLITQRLKIVNMAKSVARSVVIDTEEEEFEFSTANLSGIKDLIEAVNERLASAVDMPMTVLFGRSPVGLGGSGGHEQDNWYDCVANYQEVECRPPMERLFEIIASTKQGPTEGLIPAKFGFNFVPLKQMTEAEKADVKLKTAQADALYVTNGVLTADEVAVSRFGSGEFDMETKINVSLRTPIDNGEEEETVDLLNPDISELGQVTVRGAHFATLNSQTVNDEDDDLVVQAKIELQKAQKKLKVNPKNKRNQNRVATAMKALTLAQRKDNDDPMDDNPFVDATKDPLKNGNAALENEMNDQENSLTVEQRLNKQTSEAAPINFAPERTSKNTKPTVSAVDPVNEYDSEDKKRPAQTIIISKKIAPTAEEATKIAAKYGEAKSVDETSQSFRFRQADPASFVEGSMRTWENPNAPGVKIVFGALKKSDKKQDGLYDRWERLFNMSVYSFIKTQGEIDQKRLDEKQLEVISDQEKIVALKEKLKPEWNADDWALASRQVRAIEKLLINKTKLFDKGKPTDKLIALKALGHNPMLAKE